MLGRDDPADLVGAEHGRDDEQLQQGPGAAARHGDPVPPLPGAVLGAPLRLLDELVRRYPDHRSPRHDALRRPVPAMWPCRIFTRGLPPDFGPRHRGSLAGILRRVREPGRPSAGRRSARGRPRRGPGAAAPAPQPGIGEHGQLPAPVRRGSARARPSRVSSSRATACESRLGEELAGPRARSSAAPVRRLGQHRPASVVGVRDAGVALQLPVERRRCSSCGGREEGAPGRAARPRPASGSRPPHLLNAQL